MTRVKTIIRLHRVKDLFSINEYCYFTDFFTKMCILARWNYCSQFMFTWRSGVRVAEWKGLLILDNGVPGPNPNNVNTVNSLYTGTRYNNKNCYNDNLNVRKPSLKRWQLMRNYARIHCSRYLDPSYQILSLMSNWFLSPDYFPYVFIVFQLRVCRTTFMWTLRLDLVHHFQSLFRSQLPRISNSDHDEGKNVRCGAAGTLNCKGRV